MGRIIRLDHTGHTVVREWDPAVQAQVEEARLTFEEIVAGQFAYAPVQEAPGKFEQIRTFDPEVEEIIVRTPLVGG